MCTNLAHSFEVYDRDTRPGNPLSRITLIHYTTVGLPYSQCLDNMCMYSICVLHHWMSLSSSAQSPPPCHYILSISPQGTCHVYWFEPGVRRMPLLVPSCQNLFSPPLPTQVVGFRVYCTTVTSVCSHRLSS